MSNILTITLNPTIDKSTFVKSLTPDQKEDADALYLKLTCEL